MSGAWILVSRLFFWMSLAILAFIFSGSHAHASGKIFYGSRAGMQVSVVRVANIGTERAAIYVEHRREDARKFCIDYLRDRSEKCVRKTLEETLLSDKLVGNCKTGVFTSLWGDSLKFAGERRAKKNDDGPKYLILKDGAALDGSSASGYDVYLGQFKALCPQRVGL
jgi:hypothetical protein